jgi:hypothetical protein
MPLVVEGVAGGERRSLPLGGAAIEVLWGPGQAGQR